MATEIKHENAGTCLRNRSVFEVISTFSYQISAVTKHGKLILFIDLDAEFHVLKLLFEEFLSKIIRKFDFTC